MERVEISGVWAQTAGAVIKNDTVETIGRRGASMEPFSRTYGPRQGRRDVVL